MLLCAGREAEQCSYFNAIASSEANGRVGAAHIP